jgi:hypothetical protein
MTIKILNILSLMTTFGNKSSELSDLLRTSVIVEHNLSSWYFVFLLSMFSAYAITRMYLGNILVNTMYATIRYNSAIKVINDNSQLQKQIDQVLFGFYFLLAAFFLMILMQRYNYHPYGLEGFKLFVFNAALLMLILITRSAVLHILGAIFDQRKIFNEYLNHVYFYNQFSGILLLPMTFLMIYTKGIFNDIIVFLTIFLLVAIFIIRIIRGVVFSSKHSVLNFYLFLYLCALEIVPLLLLLKWMNVVSISL